MNAWDDGLAAQGLQGDESLQSDAVPVARGLAPVRPRSGRKPANEFYLTDRGC
jgi:hypothetical protein